MRFRRVSACGSSRSVLRSDDPVNRLSVLNGNRDYCRASSDRTKQQRSRISFDRKSNDVIRHVDAISGEEISGFCMRVPRAEVFGLLGGVLTSDNIIRKDFSCPTTTHAGR